jgi:putative transposase
MHSYNKLWTHVVFSTKNREPLITPIVEEHLHPHLRQLLIEQGCVPSIINGMPDHIHLLFLQNPSKPLTETIKNLKGNSSHWINQNDFMPTPFSWQTGYAAFSVSESIVGKVHAYISKQKEHHETTTTFVEYKKLVEMHNLEFDQ